MKAVTMMLRRNQPEQRVNTNTVVRLHSLQHDWDFFKVYIIQPTTSCVFTDVTDVTLLQKPFTYLGLTAMTKSSVGPRPTPGDRVGRQTVL